MGDSSFYETVLPGPWGKWIRFRLVKMGFWNEDDS
jgi:hypothetical protein